MKIYHGTSKRNGEQILKSGKIQMASALNSHHNGLTGIEKTTYGYVYVTPSEKIAFKYGLKSVKTTDSDEITYKKTAFIFEINIDVEKLEIDRDECDAQILSRCEYIKCSPCNASSCIKAIESARHAGNLFLGKQVIRYKIVSQFLVDRSNLKTNLVQDWIELSSESNYMPYFKSKVKNQFMNIVSSPFK